MPGYEDHFIDDLNAPGPSRRGGENHKSSQPEIAHKSLPQHAKSISSRCPSSSEEKPRPIRISRRTASPKAIIGSAAIFSCSHNLKCLFTILLLLLYLITTPVHGFLPSTKGNIQRLSVVDEDDLVVRTSSGVVRGTVQKFNGKLTRAFLGVPYAKKPLGVRRFAVPEMIEPWEGEFKADRLAPTCYFTLDTMFPQFPGAEMWNPNNELDEDCLAMNIWVPESHDGTVMIWIYGGGFFSGSPSLDLYDGRVLALHERSIVVNINYRLGAFGFLYFGDDTRVPGNVGLLDQQLALKWVRENIANFGGDPSKVTIFGESSGGASATAHMFAPDSKDLFARVIAKSSAITNIWATKPKSLIKDLSLQLARRLNCTPAEAHIYHPKRIVGHDIIECMSRISPAKIQLEADMISESLPIPMTFAFVPIEDDVNFFKGNLFEKLRTGNFKKDVSLIIGTVKDEGTYWLPYYLYKFGFHFNHSVSPEDRLNQALITENEYIRAFDAFQPYFGSSQLARHALLHAYSWIGVDHNGGDHNRHHVQRWRDGIARFLGDYFFTCDLYDFADVVAENIFGSVYMYYFTKRSSANPWPKWMGVMHGYEIEYVFGIPFKDPKQYDAAELEVEQAFSEKVMSFWGNFARTGEPVEYWPKYNRITRKSLVISEEIAKGNSHRIYVDVHGKLCRLLEQTRALSRCDELGRGQQPHSQPAASELLNAEGFANTRFGGFVHSSANSAHNASLLPLLLLLLALSLLVVVIKSS